MNYSFLACQLFLIAFLSSLFIFIPVITACLSRLVFELDWMQWSGQSETWSTPILLGGYLVTGQWQGVVLQIVLILISFLIYRPFLLAYENNRDKENNTKQLQMLKALNNELDLESVYKSKTEMSRFSRVLLNDFREAISNDSLNLYYQPKVNSAGRVVGAEALLRWNHPRFGFINPAVIVGLSELDGSIHDLGYWVITRCLSDKLALNKAGLKDMKIALNVSPCQFERDDFFDKVITLVDRTNIPPSSLELEITEGNKINLDERVLIGLQKLSNHGFNIAVDDFGMGYTSLRYLKSFPVNTLKIDGSIVKDVNSSKIVKEIIGSMGQLAASMDVTLVAEWVENDAQMYSLGELGCHEFQGYLFSPPISLQDFTHYCGVTGVHVSKDT